MDSAHVDVSIVEPVGEVPSIDVSGSKPIDQSGLTSAEALRQVNMFVSFLLTFS
jgi:hypothetical protein